MAIAFNTDFDKGTDFNGKKNGAKKNGAIEDIFYCTNADDKPRVSFRDAKGFRTCKDIVAVTIFDPPAARYETAVY